MSSTLSRILRAAIIFATVFVVLGCNYYSQLAVHAVAKEPTKLAAWMAYWDLNGVERESAMMGDKLEKVAYFGAYFAKNDRLFIPKELSDKKKQLDKNKGKYKTYLTFVNDKENADGSVALKDIEVLRRLFADDAAMDRHADEIVALASRGGYDGIEIDYERIWTDEKIGQSFVRFAKKLYAKAEKKNLKLRIVLEPGTPFATAGFFAGPKYVVMLYNLYGLHSSPGPKANKEFIVKTIARMAALPGEKAVAFSTGGCEWGDNGRRRLLTEAEAKTLAAIYAQGTKRDEASQCVIFTYNFAGVAYEVWYADAQTLNYWIAIAKEQGVNNISLWRLGGNLHIDQIK